MSALVKYDEACRAIEAARTIDEAKDLIDKAEGLRAYAKIAKNRALEVDAAEIRFRSERRLGELEIEMRRAGLLHSGRPKKNGSQAEPFSSVTLEDLGIDKKLSSRCQKLAAVPRETYEQMLSDFRSRVADERERITVSLLKEGERAQSREAFSERTADGCTIDDLSALAASGERFPVILADPPWHYETWSERGRDRSPDYETAAAEEIALHLTPALAADDCALFIWVTWPFMPQAIDLIDSWGFRYSTCAFDWMKTDSAGNPSFGLGNWTRANTEPCLLATRGNPKRLDAGVPMALLSPRLEHSRKPDEIHERIERLVAGPYLELYARRQRPGWKCWGNEIPRDAFAEAAA